MWSDVAPTVPQVQVEAHEVEAAELRLVLLVKRLNVIRDTCLINVRPRPPPEPRRSAGSDIRA